MTDCPNIEFRDRLPELVHERLEEHERVLVLAHVAACDDCRAELELLRSMRVVLVSAPRVDVNRIVASLPAPGSVAARHSSSRWRLNDWRLAAAAVIVLVAGASMVTYRQHVPSNGPASVRTVGPSVATTSPADSVQAGLDTSREAVPEIGDRELAVGGGLSDLSTVELTRILSDIDHLEPLPQTEPDPGTVSTEAPGDRS